MRSQHGWPRRRSSCPLRAPCKCPTAPRVDVVEGQGTLRAWVQTRSFDTRFDPRIVVADGVQPPFDPPYLADADDVVECMHSTGPPGSSRCPDLNVLLVPPPGASTQTVSVLVMGHIECNESGQGAYALRATLDGRNITGGLQPAADDMPFP